MEPDPVDTESRQPSRRRRRRFRWTVRLLVVVLLAGIPGVVGFDSCFYYPDDRVYLRPEELRLAYEPVRFSTRDGLTLAGWFFPAEATPRGTVVHFHGNAANISNHLPLVEWLPRRGFHLLMFDYRGYGESEGRVTRAGTILDGHAALDYALRRTETRGLPLFVYGQSLGGAVAVVVAAERPEVRAVVAETTFGGYREIAAAHARRMFLFDWLARLIVRLTISSGHDPLEVVGRLAPRPLLVIAADRDHLCFPHLGRQLYEAAKEPKEFWLAERATHMGVLDEYPLELPQRLVDFFTRATQRPDTAP